MQVLDGKAVAESRRKQLKTKIQALGGRPGLAVVLVGDDKASHVYVANKIKAYALQDKGLDTVEANVSLGFAPDVRDYDAAIDILRHYGLDSVRLLTNNRHKIDAVAAAGIEVAEQIPLWAATNPHNKTYIDTKQTRMGHLGAARIVDLIKRKSA